jgi:hypothetical protein
LTPQRRILGNEVADRLAERGKRCEGGCEECTEWAAAKAEELKREKKRSTGKRGRARAAREGSVRKWFPELRHSTPEREAAD